MVKYSPTTVTTGLNTQAILNANFQEIADILQNEVLYRNNPVGEPNAVQKDLDFNSNRIINLADGIQDQDAVTIKQARDGISGVNPRVSETVLGSALTGGGTIATFLSLVYQTGKDSLQVYINGVYQPPSVYTETSPTVITISEALGSGDRVDVIALFG